MGRRKADYLWQTVTKLEDGRSQCNHCGHVYKASASRIKAHLLQLRGKGVHTCTAASTRFEKLKSLSDRADDNMLEVGNSLDGSQGLLLHDSKMISGSTASEDSEEQTDMEEVGIQAERSKQYGKDLTNSEMVSDMDIDSTYKNCEEQNVREKLVSQVAKKRKAEISKQYGMELTNSEQQNVRAEISKQNGKELSNSGEQNVREELESQTVKERKTDISKQYGKELTNSEEQSSREELESQAAKKRKIEISEQYGKEITNSEEQNAGEELESHAAKKRKTEIFEQYGKELSNSEMVSNMNKSSDQRALVDPKRLEFTSRQITRQLGGRMINSDQVLLIDRMVGEDFQCYVEKIWQLLLDENDFIIGLVGMGGVGKTHLATYIFDQIQKGVGSFDHVFWVSVSQNFDIYKLQSDIARRLSLDLGNEDDERMRAGRLSLAWESKGKCVLILDDVWNRIDLETIGITHKVNGHKLIVTSRRLNVCLQMDCLPDRIIKVEPLSEEASWDLFTLKLGLTKGVSPEILKIARNVVSELQGLPLAIMAMATCMKGVMDVHKWRHALSQLQNSAFLEDEMDRVFRVLRLSYDNLNDQIKKCLLYCALYPKDFEIQREELIMRFADEGLIDVGTNLEEIFDEGHCILDKLVANYLLIDCGTSQWSGYRCVKMHDLIRDMVFFIFKGSPQYMVKSGRGLTRIPHMQQWTVNLEKVSLMRNNIIEIPPNISPFCPRLSTLILSDNPLKQIPDCFFIQMRALILLDLSYTDIKILPKSLSRLKSLVSLLLKGCSELVFLPELNGLQALSRLDLSFTAIHNMPQGLERLVNLTWMDLSENTKLELVGGSVLTYLTSLQYLKLNFNFLNSLHVKVEDVKKLSRLRFFEGSFYDDEHFNAFVSSLNHGRGPHKYVLHLGTGYMDKFNFAGWSRSVAFGDCEDNVHLLPNWVEAMCISENVQWHSLCDVLSFERSSSLRFCIIDHCAVLETLFCRVASCSFCNSLPCLETLKLNHLNRLAVIWKENKDGVVSYPSVNTFSHLTNIYVSRCDQLESLLTASLVANLHNLVKLDVRSCGQLKEIFSGPSTEDEDECSDKAEGIGNKSSWGNHTSEFTITLSKLEELVLRGLQQLKSVYKGVMDCRSFRKISIVNCPNLRRFPSIKSGNAVEVTNDPD